MSYQSPEEQKTFLAKLKDNYNSRFGNFALTSTIQRSSTYKDKDGNDANDTLIHNAFVKYFDTQNQPYPDWLGVPNRQENNQYRPQSSIKAQSRYQPVYRNTTSPPNPERQETQYDPRSSTGSYQPRSASRLQDMYNKSKQQHVPGAGYTTVNQPPSRTNSSTSGSRLRERMMKSNSMTGMNNVVHDDASRNSNGNGNGPRASWKR